MSQKRKLKKVLLIMDPAEKLDTRWDNSLALSQELTHRGTECWTADTPGIRLEKGNVWIHAKLLSSSKKSLQSANSLLRDLPIETFDLALIRKEPPFNMAYYALTLILEHTSTPVVNNPRGIRDANEKMWGLRFKHLMPETLISSSPRELLRFGKQWRDGFVIKPLNQKGGRGIFKVDRVTSETRKKIELSCKQGTEPVVCQRFLKQSRGVDKRIVLLDGQVLCAFEKHPSKSDFRANLGLGATARPTVLSRNEIALVKTLAKPLRQNGLFLAGLDVMAEKLLEVNVTSPAGMTDAEALYPGGKFIAAWADWLELFSRRPISEPKAPRPR